MIKSSVSDLIYSHASSRNLLDLVVPSGVDRPPLIVFIHGGAFHLGDKTDAAVERQALVEAGFAVSSVNYRFSTDAIWPAQLEDLSCAFDFLRANADEFGYDASRLASFGPSAGGHLSASCGIAFSANPSTRLIASVVWYPPIDFPNMDADIEATTVVRATGRNDAPDSPESMLIGATVSENRERARLAGPLGLLGQLEPGTALPRFLIMHGAKDPYIAAKQSWRLHNAIKAFGTCPELQIDILPEGTHGGGQFEEPGAIGRVIDFLKQSFAAQPGNV